ncbi:hypothetical protein [Actinophytocola sp.]
MTDGTADHHPHTFPIAPVRGVIALAEVLQQRAEEEGGPPRVGAT